jgi:SAM-dependent methyltransferase
VAETDRDSKERFSGRVADYVRARPGYPSAIVADISAETGLHPPAKVADVGSGTGISTELFLAAGFEVVAIEPNEPMREAAAEALGKYPGFTSWAGSAEATGLPDLSVDLVVAAQAFHWFDPDRTRAEFRRILRGERWTVLIWNARRSSGSRFLEEYESLLLQFGTDYAQVGHRGVGEARLSAFFGGPYRTKSYENRQELDFEGLRSRLLSSSYVPAAGEPNHDAMLVRLKELFAQHSASDRVQFIYDTEVHFGRLEAP